MTANQVSQKNQDYSAVAQAKSFRLSYIFKTNKQKQHKKKTSLFSVNSLTI